MSTCSRINPNVVRVNVILNEDHYEGVSDSDIRETFRIANELLQKELHTTKAFDLQMIVRGRFGNEVPQNLMDYHLNSDGIMTPDYVVVMSKDEWSASYGGYMLEPYGASGAQAHELSMRNFCNSSPSPYHPDDVIYGAVVDWGHILGGCGYELQGIKKVRTSDVSSDGQCRNVDGLKCIQIPEVPDEWQCPNLIDDPDTGPMIRDRRIFTAESIIHELLHPFGNKGNMDHACSEDIPEYLTMLSAVQMCGNTVSNFINSKPEK
ncbi:MAG: hypothetical protein HN337_07690 [Deltaproteobacteria bacterium]|jgi:hypothetical protein|nr:hypothetical protein [Deltaproteobacteria bacterium]